MAGKKIEWDFDKDNGIIFVSDKSKDADIEKAFSFKLTRYKNNSTYEESLRVESFYNGIQNGYVDTFIYSLDKDLKKLMRFGVAFSGIVYADLQKEIENIYLSLKIFASEDENGPKMVDKEVMEHILQMIGEFIKEFDIKDKYYHIPVEQFNLLIEESDFSKYDIISIKKWLAENKYIKCGIGRLTNLVRVKEKPIRVISFNASEMDRFIPKSHENVNSESR